MRGAAVVALWPLLERERDGPAYPLQSQQFDELRIDQVGPLVRLVDVDQVVTEAQGSSGTRTPRHPRPPSRHTSVKCSRMSPVSTWSSLALVTTAIEPGRGRVCPAAWSLHRFGDDVHLRERPRRLARVRMVELAAARRRQIRDAREEVAEAVIEDSPACPPPGARSPARRRPTRSTSPRFCADPRAHHASGGQPQHAYLVAKPGRDVDHLVGVVTEVLRADRADVGDAADGGAILLRPSRGRACAGSARWRPGRRSPRRGRRTASGSW